MSALHNLLEKLGLKYENLTEEEKKTYEQWTTELSQPEVTIDDVKKFLPVHIATLENEQNDYQNSKEKDLYLKACIRNAKMIQAFILGPEQRKAWLEKNIEKRINN